MFITRTCFHDGVCGRKALWLDLDFLTGLKMSYAMRKLLFAKTKRWSCTADLRPCFCYADSTTYHLPDSNITSSCRTLSKTRSHVRELLGPSQNDQALVSCVQSKSLKNCSKNNNWAASWVNQQSAYAKTKTQISFAVTAKLISAFVFATWIVQYLFFQPLTISRSCTAWFVSGLVRIHIVGFLILRL